MAIELNPYEQMHPRKIDFFRVHEEEFHQGVSYPDARTLKTKLSEVDQYEVDTRSLFSRNVGLEFPVVSSPMDTVTAERMAIAMPMVGGIGVLNAALSVEKQHEYARRTKLTMNGRIEKPITFYEDRTIESIENECIDREFGFRSFPILNANGELSGLLTGRHFKFTRDKSATTAGERMTPASELVLEKPKTSVRKAYEIMMQKEIGALVLTNAKRKVKGMFVWSDVERIIIDSHGYNLDDNGSLMVAVALPTYKEAAIERIQATQKYTDVYVLDSGDGDSKYARELLAFLKSEYPHDIMAGNISERIAAKALALEGADGLRVGQGPSPICITPTVLGLGNMQLTAIYDCYMGVMDAAKENTDCKIPVCADGGISNEGDASKALVAGAHSFMLGTKLAGSAEAPGREKNVGGIRRKAHRGMGSDAAYEDSDAAKLRYNARGKRRLAEGVEKDVPYSGPVEDTIWQFKLALRKAMAMQGSKNIDDHRMNVAFRFQSHAGAIESQAR
jgi:IMP dehydrogenase